MNTVEIPSKLFASFFESNVRVLFNWNRLKREDWRISVSVIKSRGRLLKWYAPWYIGENEKEVSYTELNAKPVSLAQIREVLPLLNKKRRRLIMRLSEAYESSSKPVQLVIPTYDLGKGRSLMLDGNHRLAALMMCGASFRLMAFTIHGSMDKNVLPDLQHWIKAK